MSRAPLPGLVSGTHPLGVLDSSCKTRTGATAGTDFRGSSAGVGVAGKADEGSGGRISLVEATSAGATCADADATERVSKSAAERTPFLCKRTARRSRCSEAAPKLRVTPAPATALYSIRLKIGSETSKQKGGNSLAHSLFHVAGICC